MRVYGFVGYAISEIRNAISSIKKNTIISKSDLLFFPSSLTDIYAQQNSLYIK